MKITIGLLLMFCLFTGRELLAQEVDITGDWTLFEMTWTSGDEVNTTTEAQLKDEGRYSDYFFMPDGNLKLVTNMAGSGELQTVEGTWKLEGDKLVNTFTMQGNSRDIIWDFEFKDDVIYLKRTAPDGST